MSQKRDSLLAFFGLVKLRSRAVDLVQLDGRLIGSNIFPVRACQTGARGVYCRHSRDEQTRKHNPLLTIKRDCYIRFGAASSAALSGNGAPSFSSLKRRVTFLLAVSSSAVHG